MCWVLQSYSSRVIAGLIFPDIFEFLYLKKNCGKDENRARDLFYALDWIPDLFMERVQCDGHWSLFCPNEAPGLADSWGDKFQNMNDKYACIYDSFKVTKDV